VGSNSPWLSPQWRNWGTSPASMPPESSCNSWVSSPQNILVGSDVGRVQSPKPATRMRVALSRKAPGRTATPPKSVGISNSGWKHNRKPSRTSVGKPRCGCVNAIDDC
jgi:hypothetical protein